MFEAALKGTGRSGKKDKRWKTFGSKDAERWKKEGSPQAMMRLRRGR